MGDPIDRLKTIIDGARPFSWTDYGKGYNDGIDFAVSKLSALLSVEAEPVRHGQWLDTGSGQECSECEEIQYGYDNFRHYCPNCGAKMDGGKSDE